MGLKIAIFTTEFPPYPGGIATYTSEVASALCRIEHRPVVFAPNYGSSNFEATYPVVRCFPETYKHSKLPWYTSVATFNLLCTKFDVVVAADLPSMLAISCVPIGARKVAIVHGTDVKSRIIGHINKYSPRSPFNSFETIFANSEFTKRTMLTHNPMVLPERVCVAPLGVAEFWKEHLELSAIENLLAPFSICKSKTIALSVARLEPRKGFFQALDAIARLPDGIRNNLTYIIAGRPVEEVYADELRRKAQETNADIRILGEITKEQIRALYQRADLFIHTATKDRYRAEGFGLVLLEAAAGGLPSIATRVDAIPEVVIDDFSGLLFDDGDISGISSGIARLTLDKALRQRLSDGCKVQISRYTWDRCAEIIVEGDGTEKKQ